jgi:hypothetical protein
MGRGRGSFFSQGLASNYRIANNMIFRLRQFSGKGCARPCGAGAAPQHHRESIIWDEGTGTSGKPSRLCQSWCTPTTPTHAVLVEVLRKLPNPEVLRPLRPVAAVRVLQSQRFAFQHQVAP